MALGKAKKKKIIVLSVISGAVLAIMVGATAGLYGNAEYMDQILGRGKQVITDDGSLISDTNYIDYRCKSQAEALAYAQEMTRKTAEEGMVLIKNDNQALPLATSTQITILGYYSWHNNMSGGEDPATTDGAISLGKGLAAAFDTNAQVTALYDKSRGDFADPASALDGVKSSFSSYSTAVVTLKRNSGEGNDQERDMGASESHRTGLSLNNAELALLDYACKNFSKVIVVVNSANTMELGFLDPKDPNYNNGTYTDMYNGKSYDFSKIQAAIWAGCCGSQGGTALAEILNGTINPSGHLVDTYARKLRDDPTYNNFGSYEYANSAALNSYALDTYFVEYEEDIYIGYRYYETAAAEAKKGNYAGFDYDKAVVYPMGYGLSYTAFALEYAETPSFDASTNLYTFKVKVTNTGSVKGKGVAQIYVNVPWENGEVEKAHVVLGGFAKTALLDPKASEVVTIEINRDYFTSYDYKSEKSYILDKGTYNFYLSENAHSWMSIDEMAAAEKAKHLWSDTLSSKKVFKDSADGKRPSDKVTATNAEDTELNYKFKAFGDGSTGDGYIHDFTRANFAASFPSAPTGADFTMSNEYALKQVAKYDAFADENNDITTMPKVKDSTTTYTLADMRGVDYNDPKWDSYIHQFSIDSMANMFENGGWNELADTSNGVPISYDCDSPYGFYAFSLGISGQNKWYCGDPMVAATFNVDLVRELGGAFGEEAQFFSKKVTGLYGYGCNTHRSAFGGRNYEYYSEDPLLAGKMAASEAGGATEKGMIVFMKHFVLNEQETNRQKNGYCAYTNEQAFREIYVKPWEIYSKEAKASIKYYGTNAEGKYEMMSKDMPAATGIMTSYNRVGATYAGASLAINQILRKECAFPGTIVTDAGGQPNTYMTTDFMLRRGGNLTLTNNGSNGLYDTESATAVYWLQDSTHHLLYNKANSNCMVGIAPGGTFYYETSPWKIWVGVAWGVTGLWLVCAGTLITLMAKDVIKVKEKEPSAGGTGADEY